MCAARFVEAIEQRADRDGSGDLQGKRSEAVKRGCLPGAEEIFGDDVVNDHVNEVECVRPERDAANG